MRLIFRLVLLSVLFLFILVAGVAVYVFSCDVTLPQEAVRLLEERLSAPSALVRIDRVSLRLPDRIALSGLRVLTRGKEGTEPFLSAGEAVVRFRSGKALFSVSDAIASVTVTDLKMPRVNEGYYIPDSIEFPGSPDYTEKNAPLDLTFPEVRPFALRLVRPDVLGIRAPLITADAVSTRRDCLSVEDITVHWPDTDARMSLAGECTFDVGRQLVKGQVHGQARQHNIRPLLVALDITNSLPFIDAFTGVEPPVDATCRWDVNLVNNDLHIALDLHPTGGAYRGVPLRDVHGIVDIRVYVREHYQNACITVGPLSGTLADGSSLRGRLVYENTNDVGSVFFDATSTASAQDVLAIANTLNDGTLDCLKVTSEPAHTLRGRLAVLPRNAALNDLAGTLAFAEGSLFGIPLRNASARYDLRNTTVAFSDARATLPRGGQVTGGGFIATPGMSSSNATFGVDLACERIRLRDLAEALGKNADGRSGLVTGSISLRGPLGAGRLLEQSATGTVCVTRGNLRQFNFFNGLLNLVAKTPGLDGVRDWASENDDHASADYRLERGVLAFDNLSVSGGTLSIAGEGSYAVDRDALDFRLRVRFIRPDSIPGKLVSWLTDPVSKMLFQIRLTGSLQKPQWSWDPNMRPITGLNPLQ